MSEKSKEELSITVNVYSPKEPDAKTFKWKKTKKVGDAADEAAAEFGYAAGTTVTLQDVDDEEPFDRDKPLVAVGVEDGDDLELVDDGGGV